MKLSNLLKVTEEQLPVIEDGLWRGRLVHRLHVAADHLLHVAAELLFCLYQLAHHGSAGERDG